MRHYFPHMIVSVLACALICASTVALGATLASARTVPLDAAVTPPTESAYLYPGGRVTYARTVPDGVSNCPPSFSEEEGRFFTDVQAYRWNGHAFAHGQVWDARDARYIWRDAGGRAVTFDGITFRNHTGHRVIVAGWCER